jgi:hypothetical protein
VLLIAGALVAWKLAAIENANAASAHQPEPMGRSRSPRRRRASIATSRRPSERCSHSVPSHSAMKSREPFGG